MLSRIKRDFEPIIIDNFLSNEDQKYILQRLKHDSKWTFRPCSVDPTTCNEIFPPDGHLFSSVLIKDNDIISEDYILADRIITEFTDQTRHKISHMIRAQANFDSRQGINSKLRTPHTDLTVLCDSENADFITLLYYVNSADGNTVIFNKKSKQHQPLSKLPDVLLEIAPQQGRLVIFDSTYYHCNWTPVTTEYRMVLNIILMLEDMDDC